MTDSSCRLKISTFCTFPKIKFFFIQVKMLLICLVLILFCERRRHKSNIYLIIPIEERKKFHYILNKVLANNETVTGEFTVLRPHYNILMRDDKRYLLLKVDLNEKFPTLTLARLKKPDNARYFGPFPHGTALKMTREFLLAYFGLRGCKSSDLWPHPSSHCSHLHITFSVCLSHVCLP